MFITVASPPSIGPLKFIILHKNLSETLVSIMFKTKRWGSSPKIKSPGGFLFDHNYVIKGEFHFTLTV